MEWFYEQEGQQVGPVSRAEIIRLIVQRKIQPHTLVWTPEFGDQWRPAIKAGLMIPLPGRLRSLHRPGPVIAPDEKGGAISFFWAWVAAVVPGALSCLLAMTGRDQASYGIEGNILISVILIIALASDIRVLKTAGIRPPSLFWFILPPCYFALRSERVGQGKALIAVSFALMMVSQFIQPLSPSAVFKGNGNASLQTEHHHNNSTMAPQHKETPEQEAPSSQSPQKNDMSI